MTRHAMASHRVGETLWIGGSAFFVPFVRMSRKQQWKPLRCTPPLASNLGASPGRAVSCPYARVGLHCCRSLLEPTNVNGTPQRR